MLLTRGRRARRVAMIAACVAIVTVGTAVAASTGSSLKKGQTVFFIPKDTLNPYEVIADRGGKLALTAIGDKQVVQSGTKDTAAAQLPAIQTAIQTGASAIVIAGEFAILSAASTASNQNAWIKYMKLELKLPKYKNMKLVKIYYGNDDPAQSLQATESMLQAYPNLKGIESPTTVGISSAAQYLSNSKYKGKIVLQGLGLPSQMKKYLKNNTLLNFALWNPENLGYLAAYAAASIASGDIKGKVGETFKAGKLGSYKIINAAGGPQVVLGPPFLFTKKNVDKYNF
jgi:ABC-type sugar transport system substrate-binding protein